MRRISPTPLFRSRGYTLLELLIVLIVISILVGLSAVGTRAFQVSAKKKKAESQIKVLSLGLEKYYAKHGNYPVETSSEEGGKCLYQALSGDGSNYISGVTSPSASTGEAGSAGAVILEQLSFSNLDSPDDGFGIVKRIGNGYSLVDPFGNEYRYHAQDPEYNTESYDLYSILSDEDESDPKKWAKNW